MSPLVPLNPSELNRLKLELSPEAKFSKASFSIRERFVVKRKSSFFPLIEEIEKKNWIKRYDELSSFDAITFEFTSEAKDYIWENYLTD